MSKTRNHRTSKSNWKKSCKKVTNRKIRKSPIYETVGMTNAEMLDCDLRVAEIAEHLTSREVQMLFDLIDSSSVSEESFRPKVTKFRFYMD